MHEKSISAPKIFPVKRKERSYTISGFPGTHPREESIPLGIILRDILNYANNLKEVRQILHREEVEVDGKTRKDYKFSVGIFDVISFPKIKKYLRLVPNKKGFKLIETPEKESNLKITRIENKTMIKGGNFQLNLNDGRNLVVKNNKYNTGDSILLKLPEIEIKKTIPREKGNKVIIISGKNRGRICKIKDFKVEKTSKPNRLIVESDKEEIDIPEKLGIIIGKKRPLIHVKNN